MAFPFAATLAASRQPVGPPVTASPRPAPRAPLLRALPAFTAAPSVADDAATLRTAVADRFPPERRAALLALLRFPEEPAGPEYPYRFPRLDRLVAQARLDPAAANDAAALLMVGSARFPNALYGADRAAYALLRPASASGSCEAQLNLALLLAGDSFALQHVPGELERAKRACPDDPTPLWLEGHFLAQGALEDDPSKDPLPVFRELERRFPGSPTGWSGEADTELRAAYALDVRQPFSARARFRRALTLYRRAEALSAEPGLAAGTARALAGLRRYAEAAAAQARAVARAPGAATLEARLVEYLERSGQFGRAAEAASRLAAAPRFPDGSVLGPPDTAVHVPAALLAEDATGTVSLGVERMHAPVFEVAPRIPLTDGGGAAVSDLSFLPTYRAVPAVTGYRRWCPAWSYRRDLILAGRAAEASDGLPARFTDIRPERSAEECVPATGVPLLAAVADVEAGGSSTDARVAEARQNLWRWAGRPAKARAAIDAWMRSEPANPTAASRAGEVAFIASDHDEAAAQFARAIRYQWAVAGAITVEEAEAHLKLGTVHELAGRLPEARAELAEADEIATRLLGGAAGPDRVSRTRATFVSYYARLQGGDTELRARRYRDAAALYAAALERRSPNPDVQATPDRRPEVLENNLALVQAQLGLGAPALEAARRAVKADPANPLFRLTEAFALRRLGRLDEAAASYRRAVEAEPGLAPAWNDLGVTLARGGRRAEAADAFRRAVGAERSYAFGWFNLGVALERGGPGDALAAQGAFARAYRADPELRSREHAYVADDEPYITTLDLSKPLPPRWELTEAEQRTPVAAAGLALAILLGLRFARTAAGGSFGDAKRWLELGRDLLARLPQALRFTSAAGAVLATLAVFGWSLASDGVPSVAAVALQLAGIGLLIAIVMRGRAVAARRAGIALRQRGWLPGVAVGIGAAAAGLAWAPLPVAEPDRPAPSVHWIGAVLTGCTALALLVLAALTDVPMATSLGAAALVMTASMLVPVEPLDGAYIAKGTAGVAATLALLGGALFLLLGLG